MHSQSPILTCLKWLSFPALMIPAVLALKVALPHPSAPPSASALRALDKDAKLMRTIESFGTAESAAGRSAIGGGSGISPAAHPGMRIDLGLDLGHLEHFARVRDWTDKRKNRKFHVPIAFDGGALRPARIKVHGASSLEKERKSFSVELFDVRLSAGEHDLSAFFLLGLQYDDGDFRMHFCNRLLARQGLFLPFNVPVTLYINGDPQGIYLLVERPSDAILRVHPDTISVYRRTGASSVEMTDERAATDSRMTMIRLQRAWDELEGEDAREAVSAGLELDQYYTLLAFNSLMKNADSTDEVFFYERRAEGVRRPQPMSVMGWDFDDVMREPYRKRKPLDDPLIYASEVDLDEVIHEERPLYDRFVGVFREKLDSDWTERALLDELESVRLTLNSIDCGFAEEEEARLRSARNAEVDLFREEIKRRRAEVTEILRGMTDGHGDRAER